MIAPTNDFGLISITHAFSASSSKTWLVSAATSDSCPNASAAFATRPSRPSALAASRAASRVIFSANIFKASPSTRATARSSRHPARPDVVGASAKNASRAAASSVVHAASSRSAPHTSASTA